MFVSIIPGTYLVEILILAVAGLFLLGLIANFILYLLVFRKRRIMHARIETFLKDYVLEHPGSSFIYGGDMEFDYMLVTKKVRYYFQLVPNAEQLEIKIVSPTKWQYKRHKEDVTVRYLPKVDRLMRFDPPKYDRGKNMRVYIVYPLAKSLLRQINECEMEFVRPNTDINGTTIITYQELIDNPSCIEL